MSASFKEAPDPLALQLLGGKFRDGDTVVVDVEKGQVVFLKEEQLRQAA